MQFPTGGESRTQGGGGIFTDKATGSPIRIWVDIRILGRRELLQLLTNEGAEIAPTHSDEDVPFMIISPASPLIFDLYCHPDWLKPTTRRRLEKQREEYGIEEVNPAWQSKVMLKRGWAEKCVAAGRLLGQADNWAGLRAGGPPEAVEAEIKSLGEPVTAIDAEPIVIAEHNPVEALGPTEVEIPAQRNTPPPPPSPHVSEPVPGSPVREGEASEDEVAMELDDDEVDSALVEPPPPENPSPPLPPSPSLGLVAQSPEEASPRGSPTLTDERPTFSRKRPDPETMFDGLMFYVDVDKTGRRQILSDITSRGGSIVPQLDTATHALINYTPAKKIRWDPMIRAHTRKGTWFVTFDWINECIKEGELVVETRCLIPGGRTLRPKPIVRSDGGPAYPVPVRDVPTPQSERPTQQAAVTQYCSVSAGTSGAGPSGEVSLPAKPVPAPSEAEQDRNPSANGAAPAARATEVSKTAQSSDRKADAYLPKGIYDRDDIHELIRRRIHLLDEDWTLERLCQRLAQKHPIEGGEGWWLESFREWDQCRGMFANYSYPGGRRTAHASRVVSRNGSSSSSTPRPLDNVSKPASTAAPPPAKGTASDPPAGPSRIPFGQPPSAPAAERDSSKLSVAEIDRTFKRWEAYYDVPRGKLSNGDLVQEAQQRGIYSPGTWRNYYNEWARGGGRFAHLNAADGSPGPRASFSATGANGVPITPSASLQAEAPGQSRDPGSQPKQATDTRMLKVLARTFERDYMPLYERNVGWEEITQRMRSDFEDDDPDSLAALFKQWVNKEGEFAFLKTAKPPGPPSSTSAQPVASSSQASQAMPSSSQPPAAGSANHNPRKAAEEMAALFLPYTNQLADGLSNCRLGDMIHAQHPRLTASTWSLYIGAWRRDAANFANLPDHLRFRPPPASERKPAVPPTPTSLPSAPAKRPASEESSTPTDSRNKKQKRSLAYTEQEEMAMAAHIFGRLPKPTAFKLADWVDFQKDHPARSAAAYAEHYRGYAARIDGYVESMGGHIRRKEDNASGTTGRSATDRAASEDSVVSFHVPQTTVNHEVIVISDDSDDE